MLDKLNSSFDEHRILWSVVYVAGFVATSSLLSLSCGVATDATYGQDEAQDFLEESGYTNIDHQETILLFPAIRGCGQDDFVGYEFEAVGPSGVETDVKVCKSLFKGATVRQS